MTDPKVNPDLAKERANATIDVQQMKEFLGQYIYGDLGNYKRMLNYSKALFLSTKKPSQFY
jgi:hypothetical protein